MLTKPLLAIILAACGVSSTPSTAEPPPEHPDAPGEVEPTDQHFCCGSVDPKTGSGEGCTPISPALELIIACDKVLYCEGSWTKDGDKITCL